MYSRHHLLPLQSLCQAYGIPTRLGHAFCGLSLAGSHAHSQVVESSMHILSRSMLLRSRFTCLRGRLWSTCRGDPSVSRLGPRTCHFYVFLASNRSPSSQVSRLAMRFSPSNGCMLLHRNHLLSSFQPNFAIESWLEIQECWVNLTKNLLGLVILSELRNFRLLPINWVILTLA